MRNVLTDRKGTSSVEFAMVMMVLFLFVFGIVDAARMMWHWNAAAKAVHWGTRFAVVNDPADDGMSNIDCLIAAGGNGVVCPASTMPNPVVCTQSGCTNGIGTFDSAAFTATVNEMRRIYDRITAADVRIEYTHIGLGFSGNPYGSDIVPLTTVSLTGMVFNFVTPGLSGIISVNLPNFRTSMTGEDMTTN